MPVEIPPELKQIRPYIRRAEELDNDTQNPDSAEVAYFCRSYAVEKAMELRGGGGNPAVDQFLMSLMGELETAKSKFPEGLMDRGKIVCESFAISVFSKADEEDRAGNATRETARTFYTASSFFDILSQFGEVDEEMLAKNKYSQWKAADIMKALKEGRQPTPGGHGEMQDFVASSPAPPSSGSPSSALPSIPSAPPSHSHSPGAPLSPVDAVLPGFPPDAPSHHPSQRMSYDSIPMAPPGGSSRDLPPNTGSYLPQQGYPQQGYPQQGPSVQPPAQPPITFAPYSPPNGSAATPVAYQPPPPLSSVDTKTKDALELCAFAMAALKHKEVDLAKDRLQAALRRLG